MEEKFVFKKPKNRFDEDHLMFTFHTASWKNSWKTAFINFQKI